jgi:hypothetical protein
VANNFFGRCISFEIRLAFEASSSERIFKSFWVSENSAISAAETIAEENKKKTIAILPKSKFVSKLANKVKLGSESNSVMVN